MSNIKDITNVVSREFKGSDKGPKETTDMCLLSQVIGSFFDLDGS